MKHLLLIFLLCSCASKDWRTASRESAGLAPKASELNEAIFQIYYARAFSWRGYFGVHPWVAWKETGDTEYRVAQVTSWSLRNSGSTLRVDKDLPDRLWYDNQPSILFEVRGEEALQIIKKTKDLIKTYPFKDRYELWPGPNSNTFVAYLTREIDEIDVELPPHAIGKDYLGPNRFISNTPSNTGFTFSLYGGLGLSLGAMEGAELNLLGLHFGLDIWRPAIKLPFLGRLGFPEKKAP